MKNTNPLAHARTFEITKLTAGEIDRWIALSVRYHPAVEEPSKTVPLPIKSGPILYTVKYNTTM